MRKLLFVPVLLFVVLLSSCKQSTAETTIAVTTKQVLAVTSTRTATAFSTESEITADATDSTPLPTQKATTTRQRTTSSKPTTKPLPAAVDLSDEASALRSMREFYHANSELFHRLQDSFWAMEEYESFQFQQYRGKITINNAYTMEPDENGVYYQEIPLDQVEPSLLRDVENYFRALIFSDLNTRYAPSFGLASWGSVGNNTNLDRVIEFNFGFLYSQSNRFVRIVYSPKYRNHFVENLEGDWYLDCHSVVF